MHGKPGIHRDFLQLVANEVVADSCEDTCPTRSQSDRLRHLLH